MKLFLAVFWGCLFSSLTYAQNYPKAKLFINEVIAAKNSAELKQNATIVYEDSVSKGGIATMLEAMQNNKKGVFYNFRDDSVTLIDSLGKTSIIAKSDITKLPFLGSWRTQRILSDSLLITEKERDYITAEINKMGNHVWKEGLLLHAPILSTDSVRKIFDDKKADGWEYVRSKGINRIYNFTVPIFFRDDAYCLFYSDYGCGRLCGGGDVAIYKKIKGKWIKWAILVSIVS
jgi:hypothetical protein